MAQDNSGRSFEPKLDGHLNQTDNPEVQTWAAWTVQFIFELPSTFSRLNRPLGPHELCDLIQDRFFSWTDVTGGWGLFQN